MQPAVDKDGDVDDYHNKNEMNEMTFKQRLVQYLWGSLSRCQAIRRRLRYKRQSSW